MSDFCWKTDKEQNIFRSQKRNSQFYEYKSVLCTADATFRLCELSFTILVGSA